jgi:hypothetical protein
MSTPNPIAYKLGYTVRAMVGLAFIVGVAWLIYWLVIEYQVRNLFGLAAILVFLVVPCLLALLTVPAELVALFLVWQSKDPKRTDEELAEIRERA